MLKKSIFSQKAKNFSPPLVAFRCRDTLIKTYIFHIKAKNYDLIMSTVVLFLRTQGCCMQCKRMSLNALRHFFKEINICMQCYAGLSSIFRLPYTPLIFALLMLTNPEDIWHPELLIFPYSQPDDKSCKEKEIFHYQASSEHYHVLKKKNYSPNHVNTASYNLRYFGLVSCLLVHMHAQLHYDSPKLNKTILS